MLFLFVLFVIFIAGEINRRLGTYQHWDPEPDQHNIPRYVLHKMLEEKRVGTHTAADGRVIGWQTGGETQNPVR